MRNFLFTRAIVGALIGAGSFLSTIAVAADMPVKAPAARAPTAGLAYSWTGLYLGAQIGYGWADNEGVLANAAGLGPVPWHLKPDGVLGGGHIGFNYHTGNFVLGIEADLEAAQLKDSGSFTSFAVQGVLFPFDSKVDWLASLRTRLGVASERWLFYVTGGVAWADITTDYRSAFTGIVLNTISGVRTGWTAGGGIEYAFWSNWSARVEYRYSDFADKSFLNVAGNARDDNNTFDLHALRLGVSYRFGGTAAPVIARY